MQKAAEDRHRNDDVRQFTSGGGEGVQKPFGSIHLRLRPHTEICVFSARTHTHSHMHSCPHTSTHIYTDIRRRSCLSAVSRRRLLVVMASHV